MTAKPLLTDSQMQAAEWWIERFIHTKAQRNFMRYFNHLIQRERAVRADVAKRQARYNITFATDPFAEGEVILVVPQTTEAIWASGKITKTSEGYQYLSSVSTTMTQP
jgi:hypothetical protein